MRKFGPLAVFDILETGSKIKKWVVLRRNLFSFIFKLSEKMVLNKDFALVRFSSTIFDLKEQWSEMK